jgi:hypothetical protein
MVYWALRESPVLAKVIHICLENKLQGFRTVVVVDMPWIQQYVSLSLTLEQDRQKCPMK